MELPDYITHYYEADYGPFLNICDMGEMELRALVESEKTAPTAFNRFAMGDTFLRWRREADDLLIRAYVEKFGRLPEGRPYFGLLGSFDRTLTMFRDGRKMEMKVRDFEDFEITFMYPDHGHLLSFYGSNVPPLFHDLPESQEVQPFRGRLFTFAELSKGYEETGIKKMIGAHLDRDSWAGCYVEAHIWKRSLSRLRMHA